MSYVNFLLRLLVFHLTGWYNHLRQTFSLEDTIVNLVVLQYYTAVCELGSMAKAAERLSLSRQALSKAILTLEREVGIKLLRRKKSGTEPTPAGHILYRHAHVLLRNWDKALEELEPLKREQRSVLRVGYGQMTYNLWPAGHAEAFAQAHPEVQFSYEILPPENCLAACPQDFWI